MKTLRFRGWSTDAIRFLNGTESDNSKTSGQANKEIYDEAVLGPMLALLGELTEPTI